MAYSDGMKNRIKELIDKLADGMTTHFAVKVGIQYQSVGNWIKEKPAIPRSDHLATICKKLGVNSEWLLLGKGEMFDRRIGKKNAWSDLWEVNTDYFSSRLVDLHLEALRHRIEQQTKGKTDQLKPVVKSIEEFVEKWIEACSNWVRFLGQFEWLMERWPEIPDDEELDDTIRSVELFKDQMNLIESQIEALLTVFKEEDNGDTG